MPRYDLEFKPQRKRKLEQGLYILLGFLAILLLLGVISAILMQKDGLLDQLLAGRSSTNATDAPETEPVWSYTGQAALLLSAADENDETLRFAALVRVDVKSRQLSVTLLDPQAAAGGYVTLQAALREGGAKQLRTAAAALTGMQIDKYIHSTDLHFAMAVDIMQGDGIVVDIAQEIRHKSADLELTLSAGQVPLHGEKLLRYFRYLDTLGETGRRQQGFLLQKLLMTVLVPKNAKSREMMEKDFKALVNLFETDVSSIDFDAQCDMLLALLNGEGMVVTVLE
ncbi:MAG: LCP family protein [Oscillospiraceae bacterium]|jgi:hypothetical protein|nr:LCP family protein [Oscillospiraceae bacterium]